MARRAGSGSPALAMRDGPELGCPDRRGEAGLADGSTCLNRHLPMDAQLSCLTRPVPEHRYCLAVAVAAGDGGWGAQPVGEAVPGHERDDLRNSCGARGRLGDDAATPDMSAPDLDLRLDQHPRVGPRPAQ